MADQLDEAGKSFRLAANIDSISLSRRFSEIESRYQYTVFDNTVNDILTDPGVNITLVKGC